MRNSCAFALAFAASFASLTLACSSVPGLGGGDDAPSYPPPAGCQRTACDAAYDDCKSTEGSSTTCSDCKSHCNPSAGNYVDCVGTCSSICSRPSADLHCDQKRNECRASTDNTHCVDGVESLCVPVRHSPTFQAPRADHNSCTPQQITSIVDKCFGASATTSSCDGATSDAFMCTRCIFRVEGDGPLDKSLTGYALLNRGGCVALLDGDTNDTGCGVIEGKLDEGEALACQTCLGNDTTAQCQSQADAWYYSELATKRASCAKKYGDGDDSPLSQCGRDDESFQIAANKVFTVFCGPM